MDLGLDGQVVIVTGGSRGIGRATAATLLNEGARVMISSVRPASVENAVKELSSLGTVEGIAADVAVEQDVVGLVAETVKRFGRLDAIVANAGIGGEEIDLADMDVKEWDRVIAVHLRGTFLCGREAARVMRKADTGGRIVTVGSTSGEASEPHSGHYCTAKAGMPGLTRSMAVDFGAWNIRVNGVAPGWVHTDMAEEFLPPRGQPLLGVGIMPRAGEPEELADAIVFLASQRCGFMTGQMITVDGGQMARSPDTTSA